MKATHVVDIEAFPNSMEAVFQQLKGGIPKGQLSIFTARPDPRGRSFIQNDIFLGLQREPLVAPGKCTITVTKPRPTMSIMDGQTTGIHPYHDVPFIRRLRSGLQ